MILPIARIRSGMNLSGKPELLSLILRLLLHWRQAGESNGDRHQLILHDGPSQ